MAKVAVPILKLSYNPRDAFPNEIHEIFVEENVWNGNEEFTFTGRVSLCRGDVQAKRDRIKEKIRMLFENHYGPANWKSPYDTLIGMLDQHNWDVSFYVDCY